MHAAIQRLPVAGAGQSGEQDVPIFATVSWPGLARPPTTLAGSAPQVVGGLAKAGHDTGGNDVTQAVNSVHSIALVAGVSALEAFIRQA